MSLATTPRRVPSFSPYANAQSSRRSATPSSPPADDSFSTYEFSSFEIERTPSKSPTPASESLDTGKKQLKLDLTACSEINKKSKTMVQLPLRLPSKPAGFQSEVDLDGLILEKYVRVSASVAIKKLKSIGKYTCFPLLLCLLTFLNRYRGPSSPSHNFSPPSASDELRTPIVHRLFSFLVTSPLDPFPLPSSHLPSFSSSFASPRSWTITSRSISPPFYTIEQSGITKRAFMFAERRLPEKSFVYSILSSHRPSHFTFEFLLSSPAGLSLSLFSFSPSLFSLTFSFITLQLKHQHKYKYKHKEDFPPLPPQSDTKLNLSRPIATNLEENPAGTY